MLGGGAGTQGGNVGGAQAGGEAGGESGTCEPGYFGDGCVNPLFTDLQAAGSHTCGLRHDGVIQCWGAHEIEPPGGSFASMSTSAHVVCGVRADGTPSCTGLPTNLSPPTGPLSEVVAGDNGACGLHTDGTLDCGTSSFTDIPPGHFERLLQGHLFTALRANGTATTVPRALTFLAAGGKHTCRGTLDGHLRCWGDNSLGQTNAQNSSWWQTLSSVSAGATHSCGLFAYTGGSGVMCWGENDHGQGTVPSAYASYLYYGVAAGNGFTCTRRQSQSFTPVEIGCFGAVPFANSAIQPGIWDYGSNLTITAGDAHACAIDGTGAAHCWGDDSVGQSTPTSGPFKQISAGKAHTCALRTDGILSCWGSNSSGQATAPAGTYSSVSAGGEHTCALATDHTLRCFGNDDFGQATAPPGEFLSVACGGAHCCGERADGSLLCWGDDSDGQATPPPSPTFETISVGNHNVCGVYTDGSSFCEQGAQPPAGPLTNLLVADFGGCGIDGDHSVSCWGTAPLDAAYFSGKYSRITSTNRCGLDLAGIASCQTDDAPSDPNGVPYGRFTGVDMPLGAAPPCGLRADGSTDCGDPNLEPYVAVSSGIEFACALAKSGEISCWDGGSRLAPMDGAGFQSLDVGTWTVCGLTSAHEIRCVNAGNPGTDPQLTPPAGTFTDVTVGARDYDPIGEFLCAIGSDKTLTCVGDDTYHQAEPPPGTFLSVKAGAKHACALRTDQTIVCWGDNGANQATPPSGTFVALSPQCGIHTDGTAECWGHEGQLAVTSTQPSGVFESIADGCGVRPGGVLTCWGRQLR